MSTQGPRRAHLCFSDSSLFHSTDSREQRKRMNVHWPSPPPSACSLVPLVPYLQGVISADSLQLSRVQSCFAQGHASSPGSSLLVTDNCSGAKAWHFVPFGTVLKSHSSSRASPRVAVVVKWQWQCNFSIWSYCWVCITAWFLALSTHAAIPPFHGCWSQGHSLINSLPVSGCFPRDPTCHRIQFHCHSPQGTAVGQIRLCTWKHFDNKLRQCRFMRDIGFEHTWA